MALYLKGHLFPVKYIVYYGLATVINKLAGMKTTKLPICGALIHTSSEMWRYFSRIKTLLIS